MSLLVRVVQAAATQVRPVRADPAQVLVVMEVRLGPMRARADLVVTLGAILVVRLVRPELLATAVRPVPVVQIRAAKPVTDPPLMRRSLDVLVQPATVARLVRQVQEVAPAAMPAPLVPLERLVLRPVLAAPLESAALVPVASLVVRPESVVLVRAAAMLARLERLALRPVLAARRGVRVQPVVAGRCKTPSRAPVGHVTRHSMPRM
jgi:hypothetical protein